MNLHGCTAWRQNNHGIPIQPTKEEILYAAQFYQGKYKIKYRLDGKHRKGISDVLGCLPWGQLIAVEIKTGKDRQSSEQKIFQEDIEKNNGIYLIIENTDQLIEKIDNLFYDKSLIVKILDMFKQIKK